MQITEQYKIGIFSKNLDTGGGSEKHFSAIIDYLQRNELNNIELISERPIDLKVLSDKLDFDFTKCKLLVPSSTKDESITELSKSYDLFINCTIYSTVAGAAKTNAILIYFPIKFRFHQIRSHPVFIKLLDLGIKVLPSLKKHKRFINYLDNYDHIWSNSEFTNDWLYKIWKRKGKIFYPWIKTENFTFNTDKKKQILSVGRIFRDTYTKKYKPLIETFKKFYDEQGGDWEYHIAGGLKKDQDSEKYLEELRLLAKGYPIHFHVDTPFVNLQSLYKESSIFWHATGYGENTDEHPNRMEHFGIVIVEAMASGCIPMVFGGGGVQEIVDHQVNGYAWNTEQELLLYAQQLVQMDEDKILDLREKAAEKAEVFNSNTIDDLLDLSHLS